MKSALIRLRESWDSISATERTIADYLLANPEEAMELSIHELAKRTFSSPSTVIRMCHRIGFNGYKEFRRAMTYEMAVRRQVKEDEQSEIAAQAAAGEGVRAKEIAEKVKERQAGDDYRTPHPESITSLCYSCLNYSTCNVKTGTCEKCDE